MHDLLVVYPVGPTEGKLALATLNAARRFQKKSDHPLLIVVDNEFDVSSIESKASNIFSKVKVLRVDKSPPPRIWPRTGNWVWQRAAKAISQHKLCKHWLWWETDAVPVSDSWLDKMYSFFVESGASFGGPIVNGSNGNYMAGVGFYPGDCIGLCSNAIRILDHPFDIVSSIVDHNLPKTVDLSQYISHQIGRDSMNCICGLKTVLVHPWKSTKKVIKKSVAMDTENETRKKELIGDGKVYKIQPGYTFYHTTERHVSNSRDETDRIEACWWNWVNLYKMGLCVPAHFWDYPRNSKTELGGKSEMPYLKDILAFGLTFCDDDDVVLLTNSDTLIHPEIFKVLVEKFKFVDAVSSQRIELTVNHEWESSTPIELSSNYNFSYGRDMFAMKAKWIKKWWGHIPDFVCGELEWDLVMAFLVRYSCGIKTDVTNKLQYQNQCELPPGYIVHRDHIAKWTKFNNERKPARDHNIRLMRQWYKDHGMEEMIKVSA